MQATGEFLFEWSKHTMTVCAVHSRLHKVIIRESDSYDRKWTSPLVHPKLTVQINSKGDGESCSSAAGMSLSVCNGCNMNTLNL